MENTFPNENLAERILPSGLKEAIDHVFSQGITGSILVGGTALAGYYAGHRSSDDIDIFTSDSDSFKATVLAVKSLEEIGARCQAIRVATNQFFRAVYELRGHEFLVDVVLDANFCRLAHPHQIGNVTVASLSDILAMKMATLVSRASEKDLFDLKLLFKTLGPEPLEKSLERGELVDAGLSAEGALLTLSGKTVDRQACSFAEEFGANRDDVAHDIEEFRLHLIKDLTAVREREPQKSPLAQLAGRPTGASPQNTDDGIKKQSSPANEGALGCVPPGCSPGPKRPRRCRRHRR